MTTMAGAFWCLVEDDRQGNPKKVMAEVLGEAGRLAAQTSGQAEAGGVADKGSEAGPPQLAGGGGKRIVGAGGAALAADPGGGGGAGLAALVGEGGAPAGVG